MVTLIESNGKIEAVEHGAAKTDATGKTPAPFEYGAIFVSDYGHRATDEASTPNSPDCRIQSYDFRFDIRVSANGYQDAVIKDVNPDQSWVEKAVVLKRK